MANALKFPTRLFGASGAPVAAKYGQGFWSTPDQTLYLGDGDDGNGNATSVIPIAGSGATVMRTGAQSITGVKTFVSSPVIPDATSASQAASKGQVDTALAGKQAALAGLSAVEVGTSVAGDHSTYIDLHAADGSDYEARLIRNSGINGTLDVVQTGTGDFRLIGGGRLMRGAQEVMLAGMALSLLGIPTADVDFGGYKAKGLADPVAAQDAATKGYVDAARQGFDIKDSVRVATTANITLSGLLTIDGITVVAGDRVLVKNQTTASANGIYVAAAAAWTRATDADSSAKVTSGLFCFVAEGSTQADSGWVLTTDGTITLGTTSLAFAQFSGAGQITAGKGLTKSGNTLTAAGVANRISVSASGIDIASNYAGQATITTLGTIGTGAWQATAVGLAYGGTGANLSAVPDGTLFKKVGSVLVAAVAGTDYLAPDSVIDCGTW